MKRNDDYLKQKRDPIPVIARLISSAKICMVSDNIFDWPLSHISLKDQWLGEDGRIWLMFIKTSIDSPLPEVGKMELFYANSQEDQFLSLSGHASIVSADEIPRDHALPFANTLANEALGSAVGIVKFEPVEAYFWNPERRTTESLYFGNEIARIGRSGRSDFPV